MEKIVRCPEMSVILVTPDQYESIQPTIRSLMKQTVREKLEIVLVAPSLKEFHVDKEDLGVFGSYRLVEAGPLRSTGQAIAKGIRTAKAPIVGYAEEHNYPEPEWAETLILAHQSSYAAVGTALVNANPGSILSWTNLLADFSAFGPLAVPREVTHLAGHHTSYKRALLLEYGSELDHLMESESVLHHDLIIKGHRLYFEPAAKARHVQVSKFSSIVGAEFYGGRLYGATRARFEKWSWPKRFFYILGSPLIPLVRVLRLRREIQTHTCPKRWLYRIWPLVLLGLILHSFGEVVGYAFGSGLAAKKRIDFELHRFDHVRKEDQKEQDLEYEDIID